MRRHETITLYLMGLLSCAALLANDKTAWISLLLLLGVVIVSLAAAIEELAAEHAEKIRQKAKRGHKP